MTAWIWTDPSPGGLVPYVFSVLSSTSAQASDQMVWARNFQMELQPIPMANSFPLLFEGMATPTQMTLQGLMLSQAQYYTMLEFYLLEHVTTLTDDRGFVRTIFPSGFTATRIQSATYAWKASYQIIAYLIGPVVFP